MSDDYQFRHSGDIGDGSCVTCLKCGDLVDCYEPDETGDHVKTCGGVVIDQAASDRLCALTGRAQYIGQAGNA